MSSLNIDFGMLHNFYIEHLKDTILPFWLNNSYDREYGGYFTCYSNDGSKRISTDKYIWSQGRMVWVMSKLSKMDIFSKEEREEFLRQAEHTLDFVLKHCFLDDDMTCAFLLSREGIPKVQKEGLGLAPSTFADSFVALALIAYMEASGDSSHCETLALLFDSIWKRYQNGQFRTSPFYLPPQTSYHAIPMIQLNLCNEYADFLTHMGEKQKAGEIYGIASGLYHTILNTFVTEHDSLLEMVRKDGGTEGRLLYSYVNPGHVLEDCWFMLTAAIHNQDQESMEKIFAVIKRAFLLGWDDIFGGIRYYVHKDGGIPRGTTDGEEEALAAEQILHDCNDKLWWPNTEGLYASLLAYSLTGQTQFLDMFSRLQEYTFLTFPNPDHEVGEWIQIRDRQGRPFTEEVGGRLPVKDPYHITRDLILLISLTHVLEQRDNK